MENRTSSKSWTGFTRCPHYCLQLAYKKSAITFFFFLLLKLYMTCSFSHSKVADLVAVRGTATLGSFQAHVAESSTNWKLNHFPNFPKKFSATQLISIKDLGSGWAPIIFAKTSTTT